MRDPRPRLVAVPGTGTEAEGAGVAPARRDRGSAPWIAALVLGLALCVVGWIAAERRLDRSEQALSAAQAELLTVRDRAARYQARLATARDRVSSLRGELGALETFLAEDPAPEAAAPEARP